MIGVGIDLCDVERIRTTMARTPSFRERVFSARERQHCDAHHDPAQRYAAHFAAKEATLKALGRGIGACALTDIETCAGPGGAPQLELSGHAAELAAAAGITAWHVSHTHTATSAAAIVVAT